MFELPKLEYEYSDLEPAIDAETMEIHYTKHHAGYVEKLNTALAPYPELLAKDISEILSGIDSVPEEVRQAVINNGGGHANHSLFWQIMTPGGSNLSDGELKSAINKDLGGFEKMKTDFIEAATKRFGSGWAWLVKNGEQLEILSTANQDSPLMEGKLPILGLDVWEHAYYLNYQNRRVDYIDAWWSVVNWQKIEEIFCGR
ncbi:superoxide dismutase [Candidatus Berkelbacteria bacterium]|nr:superoxide dismutase [Candidatus Berkelbacteria bacterium]